MTDIQVVDQKDFEDQKSKIQNLQELIEEHIDDPILKSELQKEINQALLEKTQSHYSI